MFSKVFDVVPHHYLLVKIYMYGITSKIHRWINDFLGNRSPEVVKEYYLNVKWLNPVFLWDNIRSTPHPLLY